MDERIIKLLEKILKALRLQMHPDDLAILDAEDKPTPAPAAIGEQCDQCGLYHEAYPLEDRRSFKCLHDAPIAEPPNAPAPFEGEPCPECGKGHSPQCGALSNSTS